jgi:RNA polymerase sigma-70 factor (ECF subfamily)
MGATAEPLDDAGLMARLQGGDLQALGTLVDRHKDAMVNYLTRLSGSRDRGEELAQEAFLRLYQAAPAYSEQGRLVPYLYRIATNLLRGEERRERRRRLLLGAFARNGHDHEPGAQARLLRVEMQQQVARALQEVPLRYRVPLVLYGVEDWPYQAIADFLGCREGTVKSRIHRGREFLRRRLAPYWNGERS